MADDFDPNDPFDQWALKKARDSAMKMLKEGAPKRDLGAGPQISKVTSIDPNDPNPPEPSPPDKAKINQFLEDADKAMATTKKAKGKLRLVTPEEGPTSKLAEVAGKAGKVMGMYGGVQAILDADQTMKKIQSGEIKVPLFSKPDYPSGGSL